MKLHINTLRLFSLDTTISRTDIFPLRIADELTVYVKVNCTMNCSANSYVNFYLSPTCNLNILGSNIDKEKIFHLILFLHVSRLFHGMEFCAMTNSLLYNEMRKEIEKEIVSKIYSLPLVDGAWCVVHPFLPSVHF